MKRSTISSGLRAAWVAFLVAAATLWTLSITRRSVAFAFWVNLALMGLAFVVWLVVPARFGAAYYRVHRFELSGRLYEALGVRLFQQVLRRSGVYGRGVFPGYVRGPRADAKLIEATLGPETAHLLIFFVVCVLAVDAARRGWWDTAGWLLLFDVLLNAYPVMSMRYVRSRVRRLFRAGVTSA